MAKDTGPHNVPLHIVQPNLGHQKPPTVPVTSETYAGTPEVYTNVAWLTSGLQRPPHAPAMLEMDALLPDILTNIAWPTSDLSHTRK